MQNEVEGVLTTVLESLSVFSYPGGRIYRGDLKPGFERSLSELRRWFRGAPGDLLVEQIDGRTVLTYRESQTERHRLTLHTVLFYCAVVCALLAGAFFLPTIGLAEFLDGLSAWLQGSSEPLLSFWKAVVKDGVPFCFGIFVILASHEFGHYSASRVYRMDTSLPYFLPSPFWPGTFGAVIRLRSPILHKRALLDVGAAGPLTGFIISLPILVYGIATSEVVPRPAQGVLIEFGEPLLMKILTHLIHHQIPEGYVLNLSSLGLAGWLGLLVTAINLLPVGQLDGGHIMYALVGKWQRLVAWVFVIGVAVALAPKWHGWVLWLVIIFFLVRLKHPAVLDERVKLTTWRVVLGVMCIVAFVLSFVPIPITVSQ